MDRTGAQFPLVGQWGHRCEIENSKVLFLADKPEWRQLGLTRARLRFTTESPEECVRVLREAGAADVVCAAAALTPLERDSGKKA